MVERVSRIDIDPEGEKTELIETAVEALSCRMYTRQFAVVF